MASPALVAIAQAIEIPIVIHQLVLCAGMPAVVHSWTKTLETLVTTFTNKNICRALLEQRGAFVVKWSTFGASELA